MSVELLAVDESSLLPERLSRENSMTPKTPKLYSTREVAGMLRIEMWRVKNFTEGAAFGLPATQQVGKGRGSRRLYHIKDAYRIAIAHKLTMLGLTPEAVGKAIREIPESKLQPYTKGNDEWLLVIETSSENEAGTVESDVFVAGAFDWSPDDLCLVVPFQRIISSLEADLRYRASEEEER